MTTNKNPLWVLALIAITTCILLVFYSGFILSPNQWLANGAGDGIKNYFTYISYLQQEGSFSNLNSINYPHGEYLIYTDNQPAFALVTRLLGVGGLSLFHLWIFLSPILAVVLSFLLLQKLGVKNTIAGLGALAITLMAPQFDRWVGHFSLSIVWFVPLQLYLLYQIQYKRKIIFSGLYILASIFWYYQHPYMGMMNTLFTALFFGASLLASSEFTWKYSLFKPAILVATPIAVFFLINSMLDTHDSRTGQPAGFFEYIATWETILLPHSGPVKEVISNFYTYENRPNWEGWGYIGILTIPLILLFSIIHYRAKNKTVILKSAFEFRKNILIAGFFMLLLGLCFPFAFGLEHWLKYTGPFQQFRSIGRFVWFFYYPLLIILVYQWNRAHTLAVSKNKRYVFYGLSILALFVYALDINATHLRVKKEINRKKLENPFNEDAIPPDLKAMIKAASEGSYDAFIALPYFRFASERADINPDDESLLASSIFSYHTHLPMFNTSTSRLSEKENIALVNLITPNYTAKKIANELDSTSNYLVLKCKKAFQKSYDKAISTLGQLLAENDSYALYSLSYSALFKANSTTEKFISSLGRQLPFTVEDSTAFFYVNTLDNEPNGEATKKQNQFVSLGKFDTTMLTVGTWYNASVWVNYKNLSRTDISIFIQRDNPTKGTSSWEATLNSRHRTTALLPDGWSRIETGFRLDDPGDKVEVLVLGNSNLDADSYKADHFLLWESGATVVHEGFQGIDVMINNYPFTNR